MSIVRTIYRKLRFLRGTPLHPQWLSHRYHTRSRQSLSVLEDALILDVGSGNSDHGGLISATNTLVKLDYPVTGVRYLVPPNLYGSACGLPVKKKSMDAVLCLEVLEHVDCPRRALGEMHRVLKDDGRLFLSLPFLYPIHDAPYDYRRLTIHGLRSLLTRTGFKTIEEKTHGNTIVTALQLGNLAILEVCNRAAERNLLLAALAVAALYPLTLVNNLLASPFVGMQSLQAGNFGYFVIAVPQTGPAS